jgi:hypothetical protein
MKILDQLAAILIVPIVACDLYYRSFMTVVNSLALWVCKSVTSSQVLY